MASIIEKWTPYATVYDPIRVGNIDGSDKVPHDNAVIRACQSVYKPNPHLKSDPKRTLFVGRLDSEVAETDLEKVFRKHGPLKSVKVVRDIVTGFSRRYGFVEFSHYHDAKKAWKEEHEAMINGRRILVDFEHQRTLPGWIPRRLGGGFGGRKESGQLRFGCRDRPWKRPASFPPRAHHRLEGESTSTAQSHKSEDRKDEARPTSDRCRRRDESADRERSNDRKRKKR